MKENILQEKSFLLSQKIVFLYKYLIEKKHIDLGRQILRSGTSIGANIEESIGGYSEKDFAAKLSIAYKEACECRYWITLLKSTNDIPSEKAKILIKNLDELCKIMGKSLSTLRSKNSI